MALVLSVGADNSLMETRRLLFQQAGHRVISAFSVKDVTDACSKYAIEVAVIGQNVIPTEKKRALGLIREHCPTAKILSLYSPDTGKSLPEADDWLEMPSPSELVEHVATLAG